MGKHEKLSLISELKEKGIFLIKGAAKRVSRELGVSLPTIYKYLEEINEV
jgi:predicted transcriptional regulator YheO